MAKVYLMPPDPSCDEQHWWNPYGVLKRAFMSGNKSRHTFVSEVGEADVIIIVGPMRNSRFPITLLTHPVVRAYKDKCIWFSTEDSAFPFLPGMYVSLSQSHFNQKYYRGGFYPHVAQVEPFEPFSLDGPFKYLFSFVGSFDTHEVRRRIGMISDSRAMIRNTDKEPGRGYNQSAEVYKDYKELFNHSLKFSKFILCPRGKCSSSIRLFQVMKARRVPVVISDDWVRPPHVPWDDFCVFLRERERVLSLTYWLK